MNKVNVFPQTDSDFSNELQKLIKQYNADIEKEIYQTTLNISKEAAQELSKISRTGKRGKYKKSWKIKINTTNQIVSATIYNSEYRLVHLLEKGHKVKNSKKNTRSFPHVKTIEEKFSKKYVDELIKSIEGA